MTGIGMIDLVTMTNAELVLRGVPRDIISFERLRHTGHPRRLSPQWSRTIGWWGGVRVARDIAEELDVPAARVHSWAQFRRLRTRTKKRERTQAQLAVFALGTPGTAREVASTMGVLPIEVVLYRVAAERMRTEFRVGLRDILSWSPDRLEDAWHILELSVEGIAPEAPVNYSDDDELAALVGEAAARARGPSRTDRFLETLRREHPEPTYATKFPELADDRHEIVDTRRWELAEPTYGTMLPELAADLDDIIAEVAAELAAEERP